MADTFHLASEQRYTHDGEECCVFLGQHNEADLWVCPNTQNPTVIARYSSEGGDYSSGLVFADRDSDLGEAKRRAVERGLLPVEPPGESLGDHAPLEPFADEIDLATHSLLGWPKAATHSCGARSALLHCTGEKASYECRGTPTEPHSAYGDDRCGRVYEVRRG